MSFYYLIYKPIYMKFYLDKMFLMLLFSIGVCSLSFSQKIQWEKSYGGKNSEYLIDVLPTADYGFIIAGSSLSSKSGNKSDENKGDFDYWIWKMDENGNPEWQKSFGGYNLDFLQSLKNTNDGGFILAGNSNSSNEIKNSLKNDKKEICRGGDDFWIIKLNAQGNEEWQKTIGGKSKDKLKTIVKTIDGGFLLGGSSSSNKSNEKADNSYGGMDYWVVKIDKKGEIEWQKTFGGIYNDELRSLEQTKDLGYIIGGVSNSPVSGNKSEDSLGNYDFWVIKINTRGDIEWQKTIGGALDDQLNVVYQSFDRGYLLAGYSNSDATKSKRNRNEEGTDFWIVKVDEKGNSIWQEKYNIGDIDVLTSMIENEDHTILLGGYSQSELYGNIKKEANGINDYVAVKISEKGEELWRKSVGSKGEDVLQKVIETRDGGYLFAGTSNPLKSNNIPHIDHFYSKSAFKSTKSNKSLKQASDNISKNIDKTKNKANELYKEYIDTNSLNNNSPYKMDSSKNILSNGLSLGSGEKEIASGINKPIPTSKDKNISYGSSDFWVVKMKDIDKPKNEKVSIEALPNPTSRFTNIIIGYDFEVGTATLVDLSGRILQQFPIKERTIPFDLQVLPEGIYVINIKTDKQSDGIKIIKNESKN
jgi:hypothetical protein